MDRTELFIILILLAVILGGLAYREYRGGLPDVEPVVIHPDPVPLPALPTVTPPINPTLHDPLPESVAESEPAASRIADTTPVDLNAATARGLTRTLGLDKALAARIVEHRDRLGGAFHDPRQLLEVQGMTTDRYKSFAHRLRLISAESEGDLEPCDLNRATKTQLMQVAGFGPVLTDRLLTERNRLGRFASWDQVTQVAGIGASRLEALQAEFVLSATMGED